MNKLDIKQMFKIIIDNDKDSKLVFYTTIDLGDFNNARPLLHKAIKDRIEPNFFANTDNQYEVFWVDDELDIILIKTWWDLYNYVAYLAPQGRNYLKLYVKPWGHQQRIEERRRGLNIEATEENTEEQKVSLDKTD